MRERSRSRSPQPRGRKRSRSRSPEDNAMLSAALASAEAQRVLSQQPSGTGLSGLPAITLPGAPSLGADAAAVLALASAMSGGAPAGASAAQSTAVRKAKEIYIGNLAVGQTTAEVLRELFNAAMVGFLDNPAQQAVTDVKMDPTAGRFAFVELLNEDLATHALTLDKTEVFGKAMKIARPAGYVGPQEKAGPASDKLAYAAQLAAQLAAGGVTNAVLLEGLLPAEAVRDEAERKEITEMVYEEGLRCGKVRGVVVPLPPHDAPADTPCRVYVRYDGNGEATKCKTMMDGRMFDDRQITANFVTEVEFKRSQKGEWFTGTIVDLPPPPLSVAPPSGGGYQGTHSHSLPVAPGGSLTGLPTIQL